MGEARETLRDDPNNDKTPRKNTTFLKSLWKYFNFERSFVFRLTGCLHPAIFTDTNLGTLSKDHTGHYANIAEKDTIFKDGEPPKTILYSAARTYIAHIGE